MSSKVHPGGNAAPSGPYKMERTLNRDVSFQKKDRRDWSPEDVMDFYLTTTTRTEQTFLSAATAAMSVWKRQVIAYGPMETREKLKSFWVNLGLVSALLVGVTYNTAVTPITSTDPLMANAVRISTVFAGCSLVFSLGVVVVSVIYLSEVDNATTERDLTDFINHNATMTDALTGVFSASVVFIMVSALANMYITYDRTSFLVVAGVSGVVVLLGAVFAAIVAGHNRFRLWIRFDSPEGKALIAAMREHEDKELATLKAEMEYQTRQLKEIKELMELKELKDKIEGVPA